MAFGFKSIGHFFTAVAQDIVKGAKAIGGAMAKIQATEPVIEGLSALVFPGAVAIEQAAFRLLGESLSAIQKAGDAAAQNGVNLQLDAALVAEIKVLIADIEAFAKSQGTQKPAA